MKYYIVYTPDNNPVITTNKFIAVYITENARYSEYGRDPYFTEVNLINEDEIKSSSKFKKSVEKQLEKIDNEVKASEKTKEEKEQEKLQLSLMLKEL